ncbi:uncharacterized protein METZ01_LOCUS408384 [marine metagenome]|uniref:Uncharacterized protein n=1 Tax=marine metagenome TaxID=408172 RepID=A0A382WAL9_9ZZZZ
MSATLSQSTSCQLSYTVNRPRYAVFDHLEAVAPL